MFIVGLIVGMISLPESTSSAARNVDRRAQEAMAPLETDPPKVEEEAAKEAVQVEEVAEEPEGDPELAKRTHFISRFADVCAKQKEVVRIVAQPQLCDFEVWLYPSYYLNWDRSQMRRFAASLINQCVALGADPGKELISIRFHNSSSPERQFKTFGVSQLEHGRYE